MYLLRFTSEHNTSRVSLILEKETVFAQRNRLIETRLSYKNRQVFGKSEHGFHKRHLTSKDQTANEAVFEDFLFWRHKFITFFTIRFLSTASDYS